MKVKYITRLSKMEQLSPEDVNTLEPVAEEFAFRTNDYYNALIDWNDPNDPIKRLVVPVKEEIEQWGELDASQEKLYQPVHGVEHKYKDTALLLCNDVCAAYCRFCFRKRLFQNDNDEVAKDVSGGVEYIRNHPEITNVLLTGGDPLVLSTHKLGIIVDALMGIEHVKNIRIGTKIPAFNPFRITDDPTLIEAVERWCKTKQLYVMAHFSHPREFTPEAIAAVRMLLKAGAAVVNQTPIIRGVNDSAEVLGELFNRLSFMGIQPYYVFACRPTQGNKTFSVPIEEAYTIFLNAVRIKSGLAKTARFILSHVTGKIEVVGLLDNAIVFRNHNLVDSNKNGELRFFTRNPDAFWLDDYLAKEVTVADEALALS